MAKIEQFTSSPQQKNIWWHEARLHARALMVIALEGKVETALLKRALMLLIEGHDATRTQLFVPKGFKAPVQQVNSEADLTWREVKGGALDNIVIEEWQLPVDPKAAPPRAILLHREEGANLLLNLPAICCDPESLKILCQGLAAILGDLAAGREPELEYVQYCQFSEWLIELEEDKESQEGKDFWADHLEKTPQTVLPFDLLEGAYQSRRLPLELEVGVCEKLVEVCQSLGREPEEIWLACWAAFAARMGFYEDTAVRVALPGRSFEDLKDAVGPFLQYGPLGIHAAPQKTFSQLLDEVVKGYEDILDWQDFLGLTPYTAQNWDFGFEVLELGNTCEAAELTMEPNDIIYSGQPFTLKLSLLKKDGVLRPLLVFDGGKVTDEAARAITQRLPLLLAGALAQPECELARLPMLPEEEHQHLIYELNDTARPLRLTRPVHRLIEEQAAAFPKKPALIYCGQTLSREELDQQANRLAHLLVAKGVGPDQRVALCFERSAEMVVAMLAVLKSGAGYLPMDPHLPEARLQMMLEDAGCLVLITQQHLLGNFKGVTIPILRLDDIHQAAPSNMETPPVIADNPDTTAYIIYTSGSTNRPKGVVIEHRNLLHYLDGMFDPLGFNQCERFALVSTMAADLGNTVIFGSLCFGGTLHVLSQDIIGDAQAFGAYFEKHRIDCLKITPSHLAALMNRDRPETVFPLKRLIMGGEATDPAMVRDIKRLRPDLVVHNHYGPTETTIGMLTFQSGHAPGFPLGGPIANTRVYLLDPHGCPTPFGIPGELFIAGACVARGYLNRPDLTAERFTDDPYVPGERMYRTGDLARYRADGRLEFMGRVDFQVKIRGYRIEPGEIEAILEACEAVDSAVVLARDENKAKVLVAYLVSKSGINREQIRDDLHLQLPEYMIPAAFIELDKIPLNANGKVDRIALLEIPLELAYGDTAYEAPRNSIEKVLALIWSEVLNVDKPGVNTSFFNLGGHSLLLIMLNARLNKVFGLHLGIDRLFNAPTIAGMAEVLTEYEVDGQNAVTIADSLLELLALPRKEKVLRARTAKLDIPSEEKDQDITPLDLVLLRHNLGISDGDIEKATPWGEITPRPDPGMRPLSFEQQRLWFIDRLQGGGSTYNNTSAIRVSGTLDTLALGRCFTAIEARHETLRTTFTMESDKAAQVIHPAIEHPLPIIDLTGLSKEQQDIEVRVRAKAEVTLPFDLERGPVWRTGLLRLDDTHYILLFTMHHICSDGWSMRLMVREIAAFYRLFTRNEPLSLPDLKIQYADYAYQQQQRFSENRLEKAHSFWRQYLAAAELTPVLPCDKPRPEVMTSNGAMCYLEIPTELAEALRTLSRDRSSTLFLTLMTGFFALIRFYARRDDLVVGTDLANRNQKETETLIGFFVNQLVLRNDLSGNPTLEELLTRTRKTIMEAFSHQDVPFPEVVKAVGSPRNPGYSPLFQTKLFLEHVVESSADFGDLEIERLPQESVSSRLDLTVGLWDQPGSTIRGWINYNSDLFEAPTIQAMAGHFVVILGALAGEPECTLDELTNKLSETERSHAEEIAASRRRGVGKIRRGRRAALKLEKQELVKQGPLTPGRLLPWVISQAVPEVDLLAWTEANRAQIDAAMHKHGAVLFRGFGIDKIPLFEAFTAKLIDKVYRENSEHRSISASGSVQTPVEYAADQHLLWHNENSFNNAWPSKIIFACAIPASAGGATPLVDAREMFRRIPSHLRDHFVDKGIMYVRTYDDNIGLSWQKVFGVEDRSQVEGVLARSDLQFEWLSDGRLQTRAVRPVAVRHPATGDLCWFAQAQHWHFSCLDAKTRTSLASLYEEKFYPRNCYFGDGEKIADEEIELISALYRELEVVSPWQQGDVVAVDNVAAAHARNPYVGERKILVCMGDMKRFEDIETR